MILDNISSYSEPAEGAPTQQKKKKRAPIVIVDQETVAPLESGILKTNIGMMFVLYNLPTYPLQGFRLL